MSRELLVDRVYQHLRERLASGDISVGSHLHAQRLADELGVSRTSVTGAIARLVAEGWAAPDAARRPIAVRRPARRSRQETGGFEYRSRTERIYEALLERIQRGELAPGETIKERRLADDLGVNAVSVHRAAEWLRSDGVLERLPRRGWQVVRLRLGDLCDIYRLRILLEPRAARRAVRRFDEQSLAPLEQEADLIIAQGESAPVYDRRRADLNFHLTIARRSGSRILHDALAPLIRRSILITTRGFDYGRVAVSFREHRRVLEAIRRGDSAETVRRLRAHLTTALELNREIWTGRASAERQE